MMNKLFFSSSLAKSSSTIQIFQKLHSSPPNSESKRNSKNSSTTPTPTISNPDILRIYVPPPPDDPLADIPTKYDQQHDRGDDEMSQCSNRSSIIQVEYETLSFDRAPQLSSPACRAEHINHSTNGASKIQHHQQPQQYYYYPNPNQTPTQQSSSSRRGSMNRKTPSPLLGDLIVECDHMKSRRSQESFYDESGARRNHTNNNSINNNHGSGSLKRLTSFEEIARKSDGNSLYISESNDNNFRYNSKSSNSNKPRSDYGICYSYKNLEGEFEQVTQTQMNMKKSTSHSYNIRRSSDRKHSSSDNSPFDYDLLREKKKDHRFNFENGSEGRHNENDNSIKSYDRFFNSDDEMEDEEIKTRSTKRTSHHKYRSHISGTEADDDDEENSSNSPTNKSIPCTPLNDTMPLLSSDLEPQSGYNIPPPVLPSPATSSTNSLRNKSRIPRPNKNKSPSKGFTKNSSVSSPDGSDRSDGFRNNSIAVSYPSPYRDGGSRQRDNKIRIKINQKN